MTEKPTITTVEIKAFLRKMEGKEVTLTTIRKELGILSGTKSFDEVRNIMWQLDKRTDGTKLVSSVGKREGVYKVIRQVNPVPVFSVERERRPIFNLTLPRDFNTMEELSFSKSVIVREGDLILISGLSNFGKTTLCMNLCGENIDLKPVLMGNEYTVLVPDKDDPQKEIYDVAPRFLLRLDTMDVNKGGWINWIDVDGKDKFTLLPVREDYAEHIIKNRINIIDWINLAGEYYMISPVLEGIKKALGRGIGIVAIQKNEGAAAGVGGGRTKEFADLELLIDRFGEEDVLLTIGKVKEYTHPVIGKTFAYSIVNGVKIMDFREVKPCPRCHKQGWIRGEKCDACNGKKYVNVEDSL